VYFNLDIEGDSKHFATQQQQLLNKINLEVGANEAYIFIDEIQQKENAGKFLKGIHDMDLPYNMNPGYVYQVETVFVEGGSNMSNSKNIKINGIGTARGTISDATTGQTIDQAIITLQSTTSKTNYTFVSNSNGFYEGNVIEDVYDYTVLANGYITEVQNNVTVYYNQTKTLNFQLDVAPNTQVFINPETQEVNTSVPFTTTLNISEVNNLGSFELEILFDPDLMQATSVELGDFLTSTGRQAFPLANYIDNSNGRIEFGAITLGSETAGPDGAGILLNIEWISTGDLNTETLTEIEIEDLQVVEVNATIIQIAHITNGWVNINPCFIYDFR